MKKTFLALAMIGAMAFSLTAYGGETEATGNTESTGATAMAATGAEDVGAAPDYSKSECWYRIPEITKDADTFYIYSTVAMSANEGDPDYASLDNTEMLEGVEIEHKIKSSAFEDSTNVFIPYYRQASMKLMGDVWQKDGNVERIQKLKPLMLQCFQTGLRSIR